MLLKESLTVSLARFSVVFSPLREVREALVQIGGLDDIFL
jgi:hypothetical protein